MASYGYPGHFEGLMERSWAKFQKMDEIRIHVRTHHLHKKMTPKHILEEMVQT